MIPQNASQAERPAWKVALAQAIRSPAVLLQRLNLDLPHISKPDFAVLVPESYLARMKVGDADDPLLRQVFPFEAEAAPSAFLTDPLEESAANPTPGLLHKFANRVLMTVSGACAGNCRYCFRRHYPYSEQVSRKHWPGALAYIQAHPNIQEVILSGGDPLSLSDSLLDELLCAIECIPHVKIIRFHTRFPIFIPARITEDLVKRLAISPLDIVVVLHANHANEINAELKTALQLFQGSGVTLLNQSVLLKGVNDSVAALEQLSYALFHAGVLPYYLHLLDRVQGAAHYEVPLAQAHQIAAGLLACLPGYLVPRLVREVPNMPHKVPLHDLKEV